MTNETEMKCNWVGCSALTSRPSSDGWAIYPDNTDPDGGDWVLCPAHNAVMEAKAEALREAEIENALTNLVHDGFLTARREWCEKHQCFEMIYSRADKGNRAQRRAARRSNKARKAA
jgi:hypothetical protein